MTISSTVNRISYTGDGSTTAFSFPYLFYANDDLTIIIVTTATGAETVKTLTTHYTVAGAGVGAGGTVTMLTAPTAAQKLVILREVDYDQQDFDPVDNDPFPAASIEQAVDYTVMMAQQVKEITDRALRFPKGDSTALTSEIPPAVTRASKALIFDASGNATVSTDDYEDQAVAAAASAAAASASASAASTSASTASTQASNASTSATNASTSATNAATAETNAETAETNAETAQAAAEAARDLAQGYATAADVAKIEWQGAWLTSTAYALNDAVSNGGSSYICIVAHTSGTFATDLAALKWEVLAAKGADGVGSGDLLAANNLSDLASAATARTNLGLGTLATVSPTGTPDGTKFLRDDGSWQTASGSGGASRTLIASSTASGASVTFTTGITSTYDIYEIEFINLVPADAGGVDFWLRVSENSGSTWKSGAADYTYNTGMIRQGTQYLGYSLGDTKIRLNANTGIIGKLDNSAGYQTHGSIKFYTPSSTTNLKTFDYIFNVPVNNGGNDGAKQSGNGWYVGTTNAINGVQLLTSASGWTSGTFRLWGWSKT